MEALELVARRLLMPRVHRVFHAVGLLGPGMDRAGMELVLTTNAPHLALPRKMAADTWSTHFSYTVMEACYVTLRFREGRLASVHMSDANQPGHCPGSPHDWSIAPELQSQDRR
jgi:hypothetical protein